MSSQFLTNYTAITFLDKIKDNLRRWKAVHMGGLLLQHTSISDIPPQKLLHPAEYAQ